MPSVITASLSNGTFGPTGTEGVRPRDLEVDLAFFVGSGTSKITVVGARPARMATGSVDRVPRVALPARPERAEAFAAGTATKRGSTTPVPG